MKTVNVCTLFLVLHVMLADIASSGFHDRLSGLIICCNDVFHCLGIESLNALRRWDGRCCGVRHIFPFHQLTIIQVNHRFGRAVSIF